MLSTHGTWASFAVRHRSAPGHVAPVTSCGAIGYAASRSSGIPHGLISHIAMRCMMVQARRGESRLRKPAVVVPMIGLDEAGTVPCAPDGAGLESATSDNDRQRPGARPDWLADNRTKWSEHVTDGAHHGASIGLPEEAVEARRRREV